MKALKILVVTLSDVAHVEQIQAKKDGRLRNTIFVVIRF
jgi:hypothetical protein